MHTLNKSLLGLLLLLPTLAFAATDISREELLQKQAHHEPVSIVDVRTPEEFAAGHVPGAVNIPHEQAAARVNDFRALQKKGELVLYCKSGRRAGLAASALENAGLKGLRHLDGDIQGWQASGLTMEKSAAPAPATP